jgi:hypothetical protein
VEARVGSCVRSMKEGMESGLRLKKGFRRKDAHQVDNLQTRGSLILGVFHNVLSSLHGLFSTTLLSSVVGTTRDTSLVEKRAIRRPLGHLCAKAATTQHIYCHACQHETSRKRSSFHSK